MVRRNQCASDHFTRHPNGKAAFGDEVKTWPTSFAQDVLELRAFGATSSTQRYERGVLISAREHSIRSDGASSQI